MYEREKKRKQRRDTTGKFAGQGHVPEGHYGDSRGTNGGVPDVSPHGPTVPARPQPTPNGVGDAPAKPKPARKSRIPDDWVPNDSHREKARELGIDLDAEAERFRDHAIANGKTFVDWSRGFHTWLNNALKFGTPTTNRPAKRDSPRTFDQMRHDQNLELWSRVKAEEEGDDPWQRQLGA